MLMSSFDHGRDLFAFFAIAIPLVSQMAAFPGAWMVATPFTFS
jgi:hypothetical protein